MVIIFPLYSTTAATIFAISYIFCSKVLLSIAKSVDREFKKAYRMQKIKRLGDENHFCSKKGYGGTEEVNVSSINLVSQSSSISKVIANYITLDPNNSNWELEREFTLTLINGDWIITDLKNINANSF